MNFIKWAILVIIGAMLLCGSCCKLGRVLILKVVQCIFSDSIRYTSFLYLNFQF